MNDHSQDVSQSSPLADVNVAKIHAISHDTKKKKKKSRLGKSPWNSREGLCQQRTQ